MQWQSEKGEVLLKGVGTLRYVLILSENIVCDSSVTPTANLRTKILDFGGFDSSIIFIIRGGIMVSVGKVSAIWSREILVGLILVWRLGVQSFRWNQRCHDKHMRQQVGTPGKIHNTCLHVLILSVTYLAIGIGSVGPTHWCTPFSRHVWFPPKTCRGQYNLLAPSLLLERVYLSLSHLHFSISEIFLLACLSFVLALSGCERTIVEL